MRLKVPQRRQIVSILKTRYGEHSRIWLLGSRIDDAARGGDVDFYIETERARAAQGAVRDRHEVALALEEVMEVITVDLLVHYPGEQELPLQTLAKTNGIQIDASGQ
jgi:hypothetical protein